VSGYYAYRGFSLRKAALHTRVLITSFIITTAAAVALGVVMYRVRTGLTPGGAREWYRGDAAAGALEEAAKTPQELLDATHPHLFGQAFLFFVLCHLFALTPVKHGYKVALFTAAYLAVLLDAASPWLIRFVHPGFGWLQVVGNGLTVTTFLILVMVPLREMWWSAGRREPRAVEV
jgi:hypothetical protein